MKILGTICITFLLSVMVAILLIATNHHDSVQRMTEDSYFHTFVTAVGITVMSRWVVDRASGEE